MGNERGFVTVATGKEFYYTLAENLLKSYHYFCKKKNREPLPFAIICDRKNTVTLKFDKAIIIDNPHFSFLDKIEILNRAPFFENIFIDADCLIYNDINSIFDFFTGLDGVRFFGYNYDLSSNLGWFKYENTGKYKEMIEFIPAFHGGIFYFVDDEKTKEMYRLSQEIYADYYNFKFRMFDKPADEPILSLCAAILKLKVVELNTTNQDVILFVPAVKKFSCDILKHKLIGIGKDNGCIRNIKILHWQNLFTKGPRYRYEIKKLELAENKYQRIKLLWYGIEYCCLIVIEEFKTIIDKGKCYVTKHKRLRNFLHGIKLMLSNEKDKEDMD